MTLVVKEVDQREWQVLNEHRLVATLHLDYLLQIESLVVWPDGTLKEREACVCLALSHAMQYYRSRANRKPPSGKFAPTKTGAPKSESKRLMDFKQIPVVVQAASLDELLIALHLWGVEFVEATHNLQQVLKSILTDKRLANLSFRLTAAKAVEFTVADPDTFTFWKAAFNNEFTTEHPAAKNKSIGLQVNGPTNAVVNSSHTIESVYPPPDAGAWGKQKHPYYATGKTFSIKLRQQRALSKKGKQEILDMLLAALSKSSEYIAISGFRQR